MSTTPAVSTTTDPAQSSISLCANLGIRTVEATKSHARYLAEYLTERGHADLAERITTHD